MKRNRRAGVDDPFETIRGLAGLRDAGILTEEGFTAKKQDILKRL
ncbi:SHOCT domain-containing protein [Dietzia sp. 179-F 9C3 NHS]